MIFHCGLYWHAAGSLQQGNFIHGILIKYFKAGEGKEEL